MQDTRIPLHHAAMNGAPLDVMKLLLDANREAAAAADKARSSAHTAPAPPLPHQIYAPSVSPSSSRTDLSPPARPTLRRTPRTQDEKLPLHYSAAEGAPFEVTELLLDANPAAFAAPDKVRR